MYISNHMIFLQQFGINEHLLIFFKDHKLHPPYGLVQFTRAYLFQTIRNHVITYTYMLFRAK